MVKKRWHQAAAVGAAALAFSLYFPAASITYATEPVTIGSDVEGMVGVFIEVDNDDDIVFTDDDIFTITYSDDDGNTGTITIPAAEYSTATVYEMEAGIYTVEDLVYEGDNEAVLDGGYGTLDEFRSAEDVEYILYIAVGSSSIKTLEADYGNGVIQKNTDGEWVNALTTAGDTEEEEEEETEDVEYTYLSVEEENEEEFSSSEDESTYEGTVNSSDQEAVVEYYDNEEAEETEEAGPMIRILRKLAIFGVVCLAGIAVFYALHKRGMY